MNFFNRFSKNPHIKFHENPSSGSQAVPCGRTTDMTKLIVVFRNFANAPKEGEIHPVPKGYTSNM
jgi:hypothetical protein